jgi:hypothetical protein
MTIRSKDKYLAAFSKKEIRKEALERAHDIRKFEIDLYWKRGTYFWTFTALAFTGYSILQKDGTFESIFTTTCLGFLFSWAWYCVNRGGNFWQLNWEAHVDLLEEDTTGPLYKTVITTQENRLLNVAGPYNFSPSRINHILSLVVTSVWLLLIGNTLYEKGSCEGKKFWFAIMLGGITILGAIFILLQRHTNPNIDIITIETRTTG